MRLTIHSEFSQEDITVDTRSEDKIKWEEGCMILHVCPFFDCPLRLEFAITMQGKILIRSWSWQGNGNTYAHIDDCKIDEVKHTAEMQETLEGLFSGRIKVQGIKIAVGASAQRVISLDLKAEEERINKKIYLA